MVRRVLKWFVPKEDKFFTMLNQQSENVLAGAKVFKELMDNFPKLTTKEKEKLVKEIKDYENKGDEITHFLIETLNKSFITPFDKEDIHNLAILLDDLIDLITTTSFKILLYNIETITPDMKKLSHLGYLGVNEIVEVVSNLKDIRNLKKHTVKVNTLENEADNLYHKMIGELFNKEKDAVKILKYKEIYDILEEITDKCEHLVHVFDSLTVKHG